MNKCIYSLVLSGIFLMPLASHAAIALDRTRAVFPGSDKSISLNISNENQQKPYLAQAWLEDENGNKINSPFTVVPPLQRLEGGKKSTVRINALPAVSGLPQDRESVFWFNIREVPPKSEKTNVMQVALQTRIKMFYRPAGILPEKYAHWEDKLTLKPARDGYVVNNPTPYYMTVIAITGSEKEKIAKEFKPTMIAPKSSVTIKSKIFSTPYVMTINDFGGKPQTAYSCSGDLCTATAKSNKAG